MSTTASAKVVAVESVESAIVPPLGFLARLRAHAAVKVALFVGMLLAMLTGAAPAHATTTSDPLNGAGQDLVNDLLANFTTYVIPVVGGLIIAVVAFKLIVKLGTRFMNRA